MNVVLREQIGWDQDVVLFYAILTDWVVNSCNTQHTVIMSCLAYVCSLFIMCVNVGLQLTGLHVPYASSDLRYG